MKKDIEIVVTEAIILLLTTIVLGCISPISPIDKDTIDKDTSNNLYYTENLNSVEWMPDGSYALIVGEIHAWKYKNDIFLIEMNEDNHPIEFNGNYGDITNKGQIYILTSNGEIIHYSGDDAWNSGRLNSGVSLSLNSMDTSINNDILIVGNYGIVLTGPWKEVKSGVTKNLNAVSWNKNGTEALIVGDEGTILLYKNSTIIDLSEQANTTSNLYGVSWNSEGYALIVGEGGIVLGYKNKEITYKSHWVENEKGSKILYDVMWRPNDNYALIVGEGGLILKYDSGELIQLPNVTDNTLKDISWKPDGSLALVVGQNGTVLTTEDGETFGLLEIKKF